MQWSGTKPAMSSKDWRPSKLLQELSLIPSGMAGNCSFYKGSLTNPTEGLVSPWHLYQNGHDHSEWSLTVENNTYVLVVSNFGCRELYKTTQFLKQPKTLNTIHQGWSQMANKPMTGYSKSWFITEIEIETSMRYCYTPIGMAKIKKADHSKCGQGYGVTKVLTQCPSWCKTA